MEREETALSLRYSEIGPEDIDAISTMTERYLTHGHYIRRAITREASRHNYYGVKVQDGEQMVGFLTFKEGIDFTLPHAELERKIRDMTAGGMVVNGDAVFVNPAYRKGGLGGEMMRRSLSIMRAMGAEYLLLEFWIYPDRKIPALYLPDANLKILYEERLERFYRDLPRYGMSCPICGENCQCGALIRLFSLN